MNEGGSLVSGNEFQGIMVNYPHLPAERIVEGVERWFYFRPRFIDRQVARMVVDRAERQRRLSEDRQFLRYLRERRTSRHRGAGTAAPVPTSVAADG